LYRGIQGTEWPASGATPVRLSLLESAPAKASEGHARHHEIDVRGDILGEMVLFGANVLIASRNVVVDVIPRLDERL